MLARLKLKTVYTNLPLVLARSCSKMTFNLTKVNPSVNMAIRL